MQATSITSAAPANRFLSIKARFSQFKKWLLPAALFLSLAFLAAPAFAQVSIAAQVTTNPFSNYQVFFNVTFTTAQNGLSASNFTLTGTVTGASIQSVAGSGTSWGVTVVISNSYQSSGTLILNMVNNTGVSPGVSGLPFASPSVTDVLFPLTGSATLTSFNANPGYAKTGDVIGINVISDNYNINQVIGSAGTGANFAANSANGKQGGVSVTLASNFNTPQGPLAYSFSFNTIYNTQGGGSGTSSIIFDSINPTVSISAPSATTVNSAGGASVSYTVTYTDANLGNTNLTTSGITLNATGTATGTVGVSGSGAAYTVTISNITGTGTLGISVGAGYAVDLAGNTEATGAGPSATVSAQPVIPPSIAYTGPQAYLLNTAITPLSPGTVTTTTSFFANTTSTQGVAVDNAGNAYNIASNGNVIMYPVNGATPLIAYSGTAVSGSLAVAGSTVIFAVNSQLEAMDYIGGVFQTPVVIGSTSASVISTAATHPASGPELAVVFKGTSNSQIYFTTRTGGVWSTPAAIANALEGFAMALNTYQGGLKMAYYGQDNNLYYATYSGGAWSAPASWSTPAFSPPPPLDFALDGQGNVWYGFGTAISEITPGATSGSTKLTLTSPTFGICFSASGDLYVNCKPQIEEIKTAGNFQINPALPAGLSINSTTGIISGSPTALSAATNYTVTATAGSSNLTANVNIATITTPALSYGGAVNAIIGTAITPITPASTSIAAQKYNSTITTFANVNLPTGLTVDAAGNVYVNEINGISEIPAGGGTQTALNFGYPGPISFDGAGNLYVPNSLSGSPYAFAMHQGVSTTTFSGGGQPFLHQFKVSQGLAVDQAGNVYVCAPETNAVYEYPNRLSQNGFFNCFAIGTGFSSVSGIAADAAGNIYVSDAGAGAIDIIPANRSQWTTLVSGLGAPANLCIDGAGNLYFSDNNANTISEIQAGSTTPVLIASGLGTISALAIDGSGNLFAADAVNQVLDKFSPNGGYYINPVLPAGLNFNGATGVISGTPTTASSSANYTVIAYNTLGSVSATQNITVSAVLPTVSYGSALNFTTGSAIAAVTPSATGVATQGYSTIPTFIDFQFNYPYSVAVDTALNVGVTDLWDNNTHSTAGGTSGSYAQTIFPKGAGAPYFIGATNEQFIGMAADSTGDFYLSSQVFNEVGKFSPLPPPFTETSTAMHNVWGLATDSHGNVYGAGVSNVFQLQGNTLNTLASGFSSALGVAVDGWGNVFVSDRDVNTLYKIPAGSSTPSTVATGFNAPVQLAADATGNIFIADSGNGMIKELPAGGGGVATVISNLKNPNGVAVDVNGGLYVADAGFSQVRKYAPSGGYYISPALPAGLSFNNSTGVISGTPTTVTSAKKYKITAYNASGSTQTTIIIGVAAPSSSLAGLTESAGSLSPVFASSTLIYSVNAPYSTAQTTITPVAADPSATITINGSPVASGSASAPISLSVGANTITIVVKASDNSSTKTYTVTVNRSAASSNAMLSNVGIGYVIVGGNVEAVVTPSASDPNATITVNGTVVASGSSSNPIPLSPGNNTITIVVTAQNGVTKLSYKLTVEGPLSATSTLSSLTISAGNLSPAFSGSTTSYTDKVNNGITSVTVTPTATDPTATIKVNNAAVTSGTASGAIGIIVGNTTISTIVTAQDGETTTTYTIVVTKVGANNANLVQIGPSVTPLSPAFAAGTTSYTINAANTVASMTLKPITADPTAIMTVNGVAATSNTTFGPIALAEGAVTPINIVVTAQDGVTTKTYAIAVTRAASAVATLSGITLSSGTLSPVFAAATTGYTASVPNSAASITLTPISTDANATIKVNGTATTSGTVSAPIALAPGATTAISVVVTAQNGTTTKTYTISVTRAASAIATLSSITLSSGTLSPVFAAATAAYTSSVPNTTATLTLTPIATDANATIKVNGTAVATGAASGAIALSVGANTITTVVTAQDGTTTQAYTITVTRAPSINASLASMSPSITPLSPAFAPGTLSYTLAVKNTVLSMTVKPVTSDPTATLKVNGTSQASGAVSAPIALAVGSNTITVLVTAQDGKTTKTYTIVATRAASGADAFGPGISVNKPIETASLEGDAILVHQGISPNGDGLNDFLVIDGIKAYPENKLTIMNRNGQLIYEAKGYDNSLKTFDGHSNKNGQMQLPGTYFYQLDYTVGGVVKHKTGFIVLKY